MRVKGLIAYDGSHYFGFQKQKSTNKTITYHLEKALKSLQIDTPITGSGRTDAGVHASGQIIHLDLPNYWKDLHKLKVNLNRKLEDIKFKHISHVSSDFHARFSAKKRVYRYVFKTSNLSVFEKRYVSQYSTFDSHLLQKALQCFEGEHDFDYFRKTGTDTHSSIRKIYTTRYVKRQSYHYIYFEANGFLRSQVRMMVDIAMQCAIGKLSISMLHEQLLCTHKHSTKLAPPEGLYLARIIY